MVGGVCSLSARLPRTLRLVFYERELWHYGAYAFRAAELQRVQKCASQRALQRLPTLHGEVRYWRMCRVDARVAARSTDSIRRSALFERGSRVQS